MRLRLSMIMGDLRAGAGAIPGEVQGGGMRRALLRWRLLNVNGGGDTSGEMQL